MKKFLKFLFKIIIFPFIIMIPLMEWWDTDKSLLEAFKKEWRDLDDGSYSRWDF